MKVTPTSGPIASSRIHHAREATSSRYSFATSHEKDETAEGAEIAEPNVCSAISAISTVGSLGEGKKHLFEVAGRCAPGGGLSRELVERTFAADRPAAQQDEAIAHACRVLDLMNRQKHRPAGRRVGAQ